MEYRLLPIGMQTFSELRERMAKEQKLSVEETLDRLQKMYDGYHSSEDSPDIIALTQKMREHDIDGAMTLARAFIGGIPYMATHQDEGYHRTLVYLLRRLAKPYLTRVEEMSAAGRADLVLETKDAVCRFEFKIRGSAQTAIRQIESKGYLVPCSAGTKRLYKIGCAFNKRRRTLGKWIVVRGQ